MKYFTCLRKMSDVHALFRASGERNCSGGIFDEMGPLVHIGYPVRATGLEHTPSSIVAPR